MIRSSYPEDRKFILNAWLRSYSCSPTALAVTPHDGEVHTKVCVSCGAHELRKRQLDGVARYAAGATYWKEQHALVERLLIASNVAVWESPTDALIDGWICRDWRAPVLHYVYVRHSARHTGVARALVADLADSPTEYTHWRPGVVGDRLPARWTYNPYALTRAA